MDRNRSALFQEGMERTRRAPVGRNLTGLSNDQSSWLNPIRLKVVIVDPVIANERVSEQDNLACITGIGQDLLIARHPSVEDDLPNRRARCAKRLTLEDRAVAQEKETPQFKVKLYPLVAISISPESRSAAAR